MLTTRGKNQRSGNEFFYSCFSTFGGGMSKLTAVAYKRLADLLSLKKKEPY